MRVGLLAHQASLDVKLRHALFQVAEAGYELKALFGPQHGFLGYTQANMVEVQDARHAKLKLPIYSLYGDVRQPTTEMLAGLDAVIVDLQDVGARGYTYIWTMLYMLEACAKAGIRVIIWDRPNPINGVDFEGPMLQESFFSFVGLHPLPIRHAMTMGELAQMFKAERTLNVELEVVPVKGWQRRHFFADTKRPWVAPSPNIPTATTTLVYPGMELFEGTNLSEGRGTTQPFELFGAPFIDSEKLTEALQALKLPGAFFRPVCFCPTFDKWQGELCYGAQIHVIDAHKFRSVTVAVAILREVIERYSKEFKFIDPPYEYEEEKQPFDILAGSDQLRQQLSRGDKLEEITNSWQTELTAFQKRRQAFLIYR